MPERRGEGARGWVFTTAKIRVLADKNLDFPGKLAGRLLQNSQKIIPVSKVGLTCFLIPLLTSCSAKVSEEEDPEDRSKQVEITQCHQNIARDNERVVAHTFRDSSPECLTDGEDINGRQPVAVLANRGAAFRAKPTIVILRGQTMRANRNRFRIFQRPSDFSAPRVRCVRSFP